jgi:hypothetical protein
MFFPVSLLASIFQSRMEALARAASCLRRIRA